MKPSPFSIVENGALCVSFLLRISFFLQNRVDEIAFCSFENLSFLPTSYQSTKCFLPKLFYRFFGVGGVLWIRQGINSCLGRCLIPVKWMVFFSASHLFLRCSTNIYLGTWKRFVIIFSCFRLVPCFAGQFGQQAFDTSRMLYGSQTCEPPREYGRGSSPEWLHMQLGGSFGRQTWQKLDRLSSRLKISWSSA